VALLNSSLPYLAGSVNDGTNKRVSYDTGDDEY